MENWNKIEAVQKMQDYIRQHIKDEYFSFDGMYLHIGYCKRHADRMFRELLGRTPQEYVRAVRMSESCYRLLTNQETIFEVALESNFKSHEGYIKAFVNLFGVTPGKYKKGKTPIPLFIQYPVKTYYTHLLKKERDKVEKKTLLCTITPVLKPKRKLMLTRSKHAHDYWSYCEEMCCEWEGLFNSVPAKFDTAAILTLPPSLMKEGYSSIASGIEIPYEYDGELPKHCEIVNLEPCDMLYFQSQPFKTDEEFFELMDAVFKAVETYDVTAYGYEYADDLAPRFNFGGCGGKGAKLAIPVKRLC